MPNNLEPTAIAPEAIERAERIVRSRIVRDQHGCEMIGPDGIKDLILDIGFALENPNYEYSRVEWGP